MSSPDKLTAPPIKPARLSLRLYVAGTLPRAEAAKANLRRLCSELGANQPTVEIVDVFVHPERPLLDGIIVTPTLVRISPKPVVKILGILSDLAPVRVALGLEPPVEK